MELVDALPGTADDWWGEWPIPRAFVESARWREKSAFTDRTLQLLNSLPRTTDLDRMTVLIELSASVDHPWNAKLIHRNLLKRSMPERDAFWTVDINRATGDNAHPIWRLIDWSLHGQSANVTEETQRLCSLVLAWCFTSSSRALRDRATKAMTSLFLAKPELFEWIIEQFEKVDDLYVWERILGAAFGACCLDPVPGRLTRYANETS